jgi:hypothetical protein
VESESNQQFDTQASSERGNLQSWGCIYFDMKTLQPGRLNRDSVGDQCTNSDRVLIGTSPYLKIYYCALCAE